MRRDTRLFIGAAIFFLLFAGRAESQVRAAVAPETPGTSYPIPGSHLLWKQEQQVREFIRLHPEAYQPHALKKTAAWGFTVGSKYSWYADDFTNNNRYLVSSTCKAVGTHCYVFAEDTSWSTGHITQSIVDSVEHAFDLRTPADPSHGIYDVDVNTFGNPPDVDNDPRIIILILDIKDGYSGTGGYVAGYFYGFNEITKSQPGYSTSNQAEIYFLDCNPANLTSVAGLVDGMSTTAHEFQHMIHFNYDPAEITFVNESCSLVAEVINGYDIYQQSGFASEPNHYLFDWRSGDYVNVLKDYSRGARWGVYFRDQFGTGVFKPIVASTLHGSAGINAGLQNFGTTRRFNDILQDWSIANILDDTTVSSAYGYRYPNLPKVVGKTFYSPNIATTTDTVAKLGAEYLSFLSGNDLRTTLTWSNANVTVKAVEIGSSGNRVLNVSSGVEFHEPAFGTTYLKIHFVVANTDPSNNAPFTYVASGTTGDLELKYDTTEPVGSFSSGNGSAAGDTIVVWFNGVAGAKIDSVRVGLRRAGSMAAGLWRYTGVVRPTPLGAPMATGLTATSTVTPGVPYPVPWPGWATIDLRSFSLAADNAFAVGFINAGDPTISPRVMVTTGPLGANPTSLTYAAESSPNWYYFTSNTAGDSVYQYLVRAYVSFGPTGVSQPLELLPASFALGQNYPNPFNPSTVIEYQMPHESFVTLKVYDLMGQEIATLVNGREPAGTHQVTWNAATAPSGVYFYRITAGGFTETKKLVLVR